METKGFDDLSTNVITDKKRLLRCTFINYFYDW